MTFTTATLGRLLEPTNPKNQHNRLSSSFNAGNKDSQTRRKFYLNQSTSNHVAEDPPPSPTPIRLHSLPDVIICGVRGPCLLNDFSQNTELNAIENPVLDASSGMAETSYIGQRRSDDSHNKLREHIEEENIEDDAFVKFMDVNVDVDDGSSGFFDTVESLSNVSSTETEEFAAVSDNRVHASTHRGESGDVTEGISVQWRCNDNEIELRELRLGFIVEIEKRKHAEEGLNNMLTLWKVLAQHLSDGGFVVPSDPALLCDDDSRLKPLSDISQQIYITHLISESFGRVIIRAEVEEEMQAHIELKNVEISRLRDRLSYYESVNHEMSQRNQETTEMARQLRRKRRKQRWFYGAVSTAIALGSAALVWSYLTTEKNSYPVPEKK